MIPVPDKKPQIGIAPRGPSASFYQRIAATILDASITLPIQIVLALVLMNTDLKILVFPFMLLIPAAYKIAFEYQFGGTFGKLWLRMKVVNTQLKPIHFSQALNRYAVYFAYDFALMFSAFQLYNVQGNDCADILELVSFQCFQDNITSWMSTLVFISVFWVAFDIRRQALHDKIAGTIVIKDASQKNMENYIIGAIIVLILISAWLMALKFPELMN
jgi:uncharacterized RDD family membrane protein YckC